MKTIEILVSPTGETSIQTKGFTGSGCRDASQFIEEALGQRSSKQPHVRIPPDGGSATACCPTVLTIPYPQCRRTKRKAENSPAAAGQLVLGLAATTNS